MKSFMHSLLMQAASYSDVTPIPEEFLRKISFVSFREHQEGLPRRADGVGATPGEVQGVGVGSCSGHHSNHQRQPMKKKDRRRQRHEQWLLSMSCHTYSMVICLWWACIEMETFRAAQSSIQAAREREKTVIV